MEFPLLQRKTNPQKNSHRVLAGHGSGSSGPVLETKILKFMWGQWKWVPDDFCQKTGAKGCHILEVSFSREARIPDVYMEIDIFKNKAWAKQNMFVDWVWPNQTLLNPSSESKGSSSNPITFFKLCALWTKLMTSSPLCVLSLKKWKQSSLSCPGA
jgi:hypothetical protein